MGQLHSVSDRLAILSPRLADLAFKATGLKRSQRDHESRVSVAFTIIVTARIVVTTLWCFLLRLVSI